MDIQPHNTNQHSQPSTSSSQPYKLTGMLADYFWPKWFLGFFSASLLFSLSITTFIFQSIYLPTYSRYPNPRFQIIHLTRRSALMAATLLLTVSFFLHFRYFWKHTDSLERYYQPLSVISQTIMLLTFLSIVAITIISFFS